MRKVVHALIALACACALCLPPATAFAAAQAGTQAAASEQVGVIVVLDDGDAGASRQASGVLLTADDAAYQRHERMKAQVLQATVSADSASERSLRGAPAPSVDALADADIFTYDYYHVIDGFAAVVPASSIGAIAALDGVKRVFVDREHPASPAQPFMPDAAPESQDDASDMALMALGNASSLAATGADQVAYTGAGKVIAVIDTGIDIDHEAFSGAMDRTRLALDELRVNALKRRLGAGARGVYVSDKIPFAYDYADRDSNADVGASQTLAHGTHTAGIAAANAGSVRGSAPGAQLLIMKVARSNGALLDSALVAAFDDVAVLSPDVVNISIGINGGFAAEAAETYNEIVQRLESAGMVVNVAAGNASSSAYRNQDLTDLARASNPDSGITSSPSTIDGAISVASTAGAASMSSFSSWGPTPDLVLKPDVCAPGTNIYSSIPGGGYGYLSGTSMSAPHLSGIAALVLERLDADARFAGLEAAAKADVACRLIMGTATPLADAAAPGTYVSPRRQGAGLANAPAAVQSPVYATVQGARKASHPKADLGPSANGTWSFDVVLTNADTRPHTFTADAVAQSEQVAGASFVQHDRNWTNQGIAVSLGGVGAAGAVVVPAGGSTTVTVEIACGSAFADWAHVVPNGTYVEGFALFASTDGGSDLSVPYLGFYGDWAAADVFDAPLGSGQSQLFASRLVGLGMNAPLGFNPLDQASMEAFRQTGQVLNFHPDRMVVSSAQTPGAPTLIDVQTGLLRGARTLVYGQYYADGRFIDDYTVDFMRKSYYSSADERVISAEESTSEGVTFDMTDANGPLPDGLYRIIERAAVAGVPDAWQELSYDVHYDTVGPAITGVSYDESAGEPCVVVSASDATFVAGVSVFAESSQAGNPRDALVTVLADAPESTDEAGNGTYRISIPIADIAQAWSSRTGAPASELPATLPLVVWDWGLNASSQVQAPLQPLAASWVRIAGANRHATMAQTALVGFADGTAQRILVATSQNYADALSASALAGAWNAPIVITPTNRLSDQAASQIRRLASGMTVVSILGGVGAVSQQVEQDIAALPGVARTERLAGASRVQTGLAIYAAGQGLWGDTCIVVNAWNYADALSVGPFACAARAPLFGTTRGVLNDAEVAAIKAGGFSKVVVLGGPAAVDAQAVRAALDGLDVQVLAGATRIETSQAIAEWASGSRPDAVFGPTATLGFAGMGVATSRTYPDALTAVNVLGHGQPAVLLLLNESAASMQVIQSTVAPRKAFIGTGRIFGGTAAVSPEVERALYDAIR